MNKIRANKGKNRAKLKFGGRSRPYTDIKCDIVFFELNELSIRENRRKTFPPPPDGFQNGRSQRLKIKKSEHILRSRDNENQNLSIFFCKST